MGLVTKDDGWRLSDDIWARIEPLLPSRKPHPWGCHNPMRQSARHEIGQKHTRSHHGRASVANGGHRAGQGVYDFDEVRDIIREFGFTAHIRARGEEALAIQQKAGFKARRWVVERTHRWMNRFRRVLIRWEKLPETFIAMLHLACGIITWRATSLLR